VSIIAKNLPGSSEENCVRRPLNASTAGFWHLNQPRLLNRALLECHQATENLDKLSSNIMHLMPRKPLASPNIRAVCLKKWSDPTFLDRAVTSPWMAFDSEKFRNAIVVDVDHSNIFEKMEELPYGFPRPHIVMDAYSGRCHAFWMLKSPVLMTDNGRQKPKILADIAGKLSACALSDGVDKDGRDTANLLPHRALLKSPWGLQACLIGKRLYRSPMPHNQELWESWTVNNVEGLMWLTIPGTMRTVELREIIDALDPWYGSDIARVKPVYRKKDNRHRINGRNDELFFGVSDWCRDSVPAVKEFHDIYAELDSRNHQFPDPLPGWELKSIAKSISGWMTHCYKPSRETAGGFRDRTRGRDSKLTKGLTVKERQALSGKISAEQRKAKSLKAMADAVMELKENNKAITQKNVAEGSDLSVSTVQKYWSFQNTQDEVPSGSGVAGSLPCFFSKTIKERSVQQKLVLREERFYSRIIARLAKRGSKPLRVLREPDGFSRINSDHHKIFELFEEAKAYNRDANRRAENRKLAKKTKDNSIERIRWHEENARLPWRERRTRYYNRRAEIKAEYNSHIESALGYGNGKFVENYRNARRSKLNSEEAQWKRLGGY
jgi:hypothetical protein